MTCIGVIDTILFSMELYIKRDVYVNVAVINTFFLIDRVYNRRRGIIMLTKDDIIVFCFDFHKRH